MNRKNRNEIIRIVSYPDSGWLVPVSQSGSHVKMKHSTKPGLIIFPNHGSSEVGKGLEKETIKASQNK